MASSGGLTLSGLADFVVETGKHTLEPGKVLMEAVNQTWLLGDLLKGKDTAVTVKSGKSLSNVSDFSGATQFEFYQPNATFTYSIENTAVELAYNWRFAHDVWVYTDHEVELNKQGSQFEQIYDLIKHRRGRCEISMFAGMEAALWTTPSTSTMEAAGGTRPYSIPAYITEDGAAPSGFTTVAGVNPSTYTRWKNQVSSYTAGAIDTTLVPAFDELIRKVNFESPQTLQQYVEDTSFSKFKILTDINGDKTYARLTREANDQLRTANGRDLGYVNQGSNVFRGIPVKYVKEIDNRAYPATQPRYFWVNSDYLYPVYHTSGYMRELPPMRSPNQPYTWVVHKDTWYNLICTSRQRHGIIVPA